VARINPGFTLGEAWGRSAAVTGQNLVMSGDGGQRAAAGRLDQSTFCNRR
jgi:hypothetical protein